MKLTSTMTGEPSGSNLAQDRVLALPRPMNCPSRCEQWILYEDSDFGEKSDVQCCEHAMSSAQLQEWLSILRPSRISVTARESNKRSATKEQRKQDSRDVEI